MKLIKEVYEEVKCLTEEDSGKKSFFIEGIFMQADKPNKNRRQYKLETLQREVNRYNEEYIKPNRAYGELGHPDTPAINLERVSHLIKELKVDGSNFYGKAKILDTPYGNIVKSFIEEGAKLGVSSRGMGTLERTNSGISLVKDDYYLATAADIVADPSAPDAFVQGIMENKEWMIVEGKFVELDLNETKKIISNTPSRRLEEVAVEQFKKFLDKLMG